MLHHSLPLPSKVARYVHNTIADYCPNQLLRENFTISTWILLGCIVQALLSLLLPRLLATLPAVLLLAWGMLDALLVYAGLKKNTYMQDVIVGKFSVAYPADGEGSDIQGQPGENGPGAVMILGTRSNSPLGMFAPGKCLPLAC